ncbi:DUF4224 domain-containing protein [Duganella sp. FT135W]|uniref:DUF4224 domain-containing protein n=1 Tax=Duganella flavida TaxID=2692175 RepID=A0A6L8KF82_9BURK|nr:DUF4224 domain-containing protein [Duganella flavida]MYM25745.1 DUF4224 domain-containing protein [Duganella flavida]
MSSIENRYTLSKEEIADLTRYRRPADQMRVLTDLGIPARRLHDNTVRVLRRDLMAAPAAPGMRVTQRPKLVL